MNKGKKPDKIPLMTCNSYVDKLPFFLLIEFERLKSYNPNNKEFGKQNPFEKDD
jgi:hypothetical protein